MAGFAKHIFVCTNERTLGDERGCCALRGGREVADELKRLLHERGLKRVVRANKAGCLDQCSRGATLVVYPEGVWYGNVRVQDVARIVDEHVIGGRPVAELLIPPAELTGRDVSIAQAIVDPPPPRPVK